MSVRLRRYLKAVVSVAFLVVLAAACSSDGFPESYDAQVDPETGVSNVEANWLNGCEVGFEQTDLAAEANSICQCSYNAISSDSGVDFDDFVELDKELKGDPNRLSGFEGTLAVSGNALIEIVKTCIAES